MKRLITILVLFSMAGCDQRTELTRGVIMSTSNGQYLPWSVDGKATEGWDPSPGEIKKLEPILLQYIEKQNADIFDKIENYRCQYFGIIVDGHERVYCNYFWFTKHDTNWRTQPVVVDDGGDRYFQIEYDLDSNRCVHFSVNGEA